MSANQADTKSRFPLRTMCRVLGVSSSGYHDWLGRRPSARQTANARLAEQILQVHQAINSVAKLTASFVRNHGGLGRPLAVSQVSTARLIDSGIPASPTRAPTNPPTMQAFVSVSPPPANTCRSATTKVVSRSRW